MKQFFVRFKTQVIAALVVVITLCTCFGAYSYFSDSTETSTSTKTYPSILPTSYLTTSDTSLTKLGEVTSGWTSDASYSFRLVVEDLGRGIGTYLDSSSIYGGEQYIAVTIVSDADDDIYNHIDLYNYDDITFTTNGFSYQHSSTTSVDDIRTTTIAYSFDVSDATPMSKILNDDGSVTFILFDDLNLQQNQFWEEYNIILDPDYVFTSENLTVTYNIVYSDYWYENENWVATSESLESYSFSIQTAYDAGLAWPTETEYDEADGESVAPAAVFNATFNGVDLALSSSLSYKYYQTEDDGDTWTLLDEAPSTAGSYKAVATLTQGENDAYNYGNVFNIVNPEFEFTVKGNPELNLVWPTDTSYDATGLSLALVASSAVTDAAELVDVSLLTYQYYETTDSGTSWVLLDSAPIDEGSYKVVAASDSYIISNPEFEFKIVNLYYEYTWDDDTSGYQVSLKSDFMTAVKANSDYVVDGVTAWEASDALPSPVSTWGDKSVTSYDSMFYYCTVSALDLSDWDVSNVTSMYRMFYYCYNLTTLDLSGWDTGSVTNMDSMFSNCYKLSSLEDIYGWDTSNVTSMFYTFYNCSSLTTLNFSAWNTKSLQDVSGLFSNCKSLESVNLTDWNTTAVTNMVGVFADCTLLNNIEGIAAWDTSSVTTMASIFKNCSSLETLDLSAWNVEDVQSMGYMFYGCSILESIGDVSGWDTGSATSMYQMFYNCSSLKTLDLSTWDVEDVKSMYQMFYGCSILESIGDVSIWNTGLVTSMYQMFYNCSSLSALPGIGNWNTDSVSSTYQMFYNCSSLSDLTGIGSWTINSANSNMQKMFYGCSTLKTLDLSDWNTSDVTTMDWMFSKCSSLESINLTGWNTGSVTSMGYMFSACSALSEISGIGAWNTGAVTAMWNMFESCSSLETVDLCYWNVNSVKDTSAMFYNCSSLTTLDLSGWDTPALKYIGQMFYDCSSLETLNLSSWDVSSVTYLSSMFYNCSSTVIVSQDTYNVLYGNTDDYKITWSIITMVPNSLLLPTDDGELAADQDADASTDYSISMTVGESYVVEDVSDGVSDDTSIATVDGTTVTAIAEGETSINFVTSDGETITYIVIVSASADDGADEPENVTPDTPDTPDETPA